MVVTPKTTLLESVEVVSVQIHSDRGVSYTLGAPDRSVLTIAIKGDHVSYSSKTEQSLMFDFNAREEISTKIVFEFRLGSNVETETLTLRWKPVRVYYWTSIV